jgi:hypothetical protein
MILISSHNTSFSPYDSPEYKTSVRMQSMPKCDNTFTCSLFNDADSMSQHETVYKATEKDMEQNGSASI